MDELEERFYETAAAELAAQNPAPGIMAKALVEADGDEKRAIARYIRLRVAQLKTQHLASIATEKERRQKDVSDKRKRLWTACHQCGFEGGRAP